MQMYLRVIAGLKEVAWTGNDRCEFKAFLSMAEGRCP